MQRRFRFLQMHSEIRHRAERTMADEANLAIPDLRRSAVIDGPDQ
jgi:hypothetical protein